MTTAPRQDVLVSIIIDRPKDSIAALVRFAAEMQQRFAFFEILLGFEHTDTPEPWVQRTPHARGLVLDTNLTRYERRCILAQEAIGDIVIFADRDHWSAITYTDMCHLAHQHGSAHIQRSTRSVLNPFLKAAGAASNLHVDTGVAPVLAFSRTILGPILQRDDAALALRFPPKTGIAVRPQRTTHHKREKGISARASIVHTLAVNMAPLFLVVSFWSALGVLVLGLFTLAYVAAAHLMADTITAGWTTTTLLMGAAGIWGGIFGAAVSAALLYLLQRSHRHHQRGVMRDVGASDLFTALRATKNVVQGDTQP